jgi:hypothetical protein
LEVAELLGETEVDDQFDTEGALAEVEAALAAAEAEEAEVNNAFATDRAWKTRSIFELESHDLDVRTHSISSLARSPHCNVWSQPHVRERARADE